MIVPFKNLHVALIEEPHIVADFLVANIKPRRILQLMKHPEKDFHGERFIAAAIVGLIEDGQFMALLTRPQRNELVDLAGDLWFCVSPTKRRHRKNLESDPRLH